MSKQNPKIHRASKQLSVRTFFLLWLVCLTSFFMAACNDDNDEPGPTPQPSPSPSPSPLNGGALDGISFDDGSFN